MNTLREAISAFAAGDEEARREAVARLEAARGGPWRRPRRWRFSSRRWAIPAGACARRRRRARPTGTIASACRGAGGSAGRARQRGPPQRRRRRAGHAGRAGGSAADGGAGGAAGARHAAGRHAGADRRSARRRFGGAAKSTTPIPNVRVAAAEALGRIGGTDAASPRPPPRAGAATSGLRCSWRRSHGLGRRRRAPRRSTSWRRLCLEPMLRVGRAGGAWPQPEPDGRPGRCCGGAHRRRARSTREAATRAAWPQLASSLEGVRWKSPSTRRRCRR